MDADLVFNTAYSMALLFAVLGRFTWFVTGITVAQLFAGLNRICTTFIAFAQRLSDFRFSSLVEMASATILNPTNANTTNPRRRGGPSYPVATVPRGRVQSGRSGRFGAQGGDIPPAFAPSM